MKKFIGYILFSLLCLQTFALGNEKIRLGFSVAPGVSWLRPQGKDLLAGKAGFGIQYGLNFEYYFKDKNYAIATGLFGGLEKGSVKDRDDFKAMTIGNVSVTESYTTQFFTLPVYLKLKTNEMKGFHVFGQIGISPVFTVYSRGTFDKPLLMPCTSGVPSCYDTVSITKENLLKENELYRYKKNFKSAFFDLRLSVGAGVEYDFNSKTTILFGVFYHNGFINTLWDQDAKKEPILMSNFNFNIGVMF